jgi:23S rRNA (uridine2552-2'-O)-methyltransferase
MKTHRNKSTKVKTARGRKISSTKWLQRQLNDPFTIQAKKEGYLSRAAYKLLEIDSKFRILGKNKIIIDLGSAPGSWTQIALKKHPKKIIAVDLLPMQNLDKVDFILGDFMDEDTVQKILTVLNQNMSNHNNTKADIILSDMAPNSSGHKDIDHLRIIEICENVLNFAKKILATNGILVMKVFQGGEEKSLATKLKQSFKQVKFFKPQASRKDSSEIFLVATQFIG